MRSDNTPKALRCAVYARKSTEEGLEQKFNSLDAQREAAEAFILSQKHQGWVLLRQRYDDGGYTGANTERPALQRLLNDVAQGEVDCVVVYKVDRLTRSLLDFSKIVDTLERHGTTFVAVTQQFNTTDSIGRLTLNILLSFAQFEREMIAERTRDKMSAARRKGKWVGGNLILGYDCAAEGGALAVNEEEAQRVREIFALYLEYGALRPVVQELAGRNWRLKVWRTREGRQTGGGRFTKTNLHNLLTNMTYVGRVCYRGEVYPGEQPAIVDNATWNRVQKQLHRNGRSGGSGNGSNKYGALLKGLVRCHTCNSKMIHTYTLKGTRVYRYYVCANAHQQGWNRCLTRAVSASDLENGVVDQIQAVSGTPEILASLISRSLVKSTVGEAQKQLEDFGALWELLRTHEKEQLIRAIVHEVRYEGPTQTVTLEYRSEEIKQL